MAGVLLYPVGIVLYTYLKLERCCLLEGCLCLIDTNAKEPAQTIPWTEVQTEIRWALWTLWAIELCVWSSILSVMCCSWTWVLLLGGNCVYVCSCTLACFHSFGYLQGADRNVKETVVDECGHLCQARFVSTGALVQPVLAVANCVSPFVCGLCLDNICLISGCTCQVSGAHCVSASFTVCTVAHSFVACSPSTLTTMTMCRLHPSVALWWRCWEQPY